MELKANHAIRAEIALLIGEIQCMLRQAINIGLVEGLIEQQVNVLV
ncbi:hypothetical protein QW180_30275 [Vibrio sinaloensis]|nr:hypothetical protein [Vibrio sinaloensis]